ncbi:hypothetical protein JXL19_07210 [bacterium]|nr:hypothetical protein [bacterium]
MSDTLLVSVKCPECGGPLSYPEGAYTFKCLYCGSVLRIKNEGIDLKYIIPCRLNRNEMPPLIRKILFEKKIPVRKTCSINQISIIYKPFWYLKGMVYYSRVGSDGNETTAKTWYYSFQANPDIVSTFNSLSVRTEVLALEPYNSEDYRNEGTIILPLMFDREAAYKYAEFAADMNIQISAAKADYERLSLIGEQLFVIYYPVICVVCSDCDRSHTLFIDGINKCLLEDNAGGKSSTFQSDNNEGIMNPESTKGDENCQKGFSDETPYKSAPLGRTATRPTENPQEKDENSYSIKLSLLSHRCKNCGHDLTAREFDIIFYCETCYRLWLLEKGEYFPLIIKCIESESEEESVYMPFWRFEVNIVSESAGITLKTIGDLSKFMKLGQFLLRNEDPGRPVSLYCPSLVTKNAKALLKLAAKINLHQRALPIAKRDRLPFDKAMNASLPDNEAEDMLWVIVFSIIGRRDKRAIDFYGDFKIKVINKELIWYPFEDKGEFLVDRFHQYNFPKKSMDINVY